MDDRYADILQTCLTRLEAGASIEECLAAFPAERAALEGPLRTATRLRGQTWPALPQASRAAIQSRLREQVAAYRTGGAPPVSSPAPAAALPSSSWAGLDLGAPLGRLLRTLGYRGSLSQPVLRLAAVGLGVVLALVLGAGAFAAARAVIQAIAPPPTARPTAAPSNVYTFSGPIQQLGENAWIVAELPVAIDATTVITGTPALGAAATVRGELRDDGSLLARTITITGGPAPSATTPVPTLAPATAPPAAPTVEPSPAPTVPLTAAPAPAPAVSFAALRASIQAGINDGRVEVKGGEFLLKKLDQAGEAAGEGNTSKLGGQLRAMRQKTLEEVQTGKMDAAFGQQLLDGIDALAASYGISVANAEGDEDEDEDD